MAGFKISAGGQPRYAGLASQQVSGWLRDSEESSLYRPVLPMMERK
jgi:hypothetical protein